MTHQNAIGLAAGHAAKIVARLDMHKKSEKVQILFLLRFLASWYRTWVNWGLGTQIRKKFANFDLQMHFLGLGKSLACFSTLQGFPRFFLFSIFLIFSTSILSQ